MKAIVTAIGEDRVCIISVVSSVLAENKLNVMDISQTILHESLAMMSLWI